MANRRLRSRSCPFAINFQAKVALVWVKRISPVYRQLSINVLREACQFLAFHPLLAICPWNEMNVLLFDPLALQFRILDYSKQLLPQTVCGECMCIGYDQVFMCGGFIMKFRPRRRTGKAIVINSEQVKQLPDMETKRSSHGLHFHEAERLVFVFGGLNVRGDGIKNCEQYSFVKGTWKPLPEMTEAKTRISTCGYKKKVYLCAPDSKLIEVFAIASKQFTALPLQPPSSSYHHRVVIWNDQLVVLNIDSVQRWNVDSLEYIGESKVPMSDGAKCAMVVNGILFTLCHYECISLNLETMIPSPKHQFRDR